MNWITYSVPFNTKTMVLADTLREKASHSSLFEGGKGKIPHFFMQVLL